MLWSISVTVPTEFFWVGHFIRTWNLFTSQGLKLTVSQPVVQRVERWCMQESNGLIIASILSINICNTVYILLGPDWSELRRRIAFFSGAPMHTYAFDFKCSWATAYLYCPTCMLKAHFVEAVLPCIECQVPLAVNTGWKACVMSLLSIHMRRSATKILAL